jgi:fructose-bisphosphate aldolase class I
MSELNKIALKIVSSGKGILAADESTGTMTKRLESVNIKSSEENRLKFRSTLLSSKSMNNCIGGVILYDETIKQNYNGKSIPELISETGAVPGIKVDTGAKKLAKSIDEKITEGLDGLRERLKNYYNLGARFTKWRAVYLISEKYPSKLAINVNAHALARYASLVQEAGMVPIVEPEVLMDGNHSAQDCFNKTSEVIKKCFDELIFQKVELKGVLLKPNMILPGSKSNQKISSDEIAELTIKCLINSVPSEIPGIAFLSGGQSELEATKNLNTINKHNKSKFVMTYSYGRALQQSALKHWSKNIKDIEGTQKIFNHRANMCSLASRGKWVEEVDKA